MIRHHCREARKLLAVAAAVVCCFDPCFRVASVHAAVLTLRDDFGRDVVFSQPPQRIISLMPSLTETVCALGACERLVATDQFSNWPPQVKALPKAGGLDDPGIESIVGLKPDLVLISSSQRITDRLHELGIVSFAISTQRYADIDHSVSVIGEILGTPERAALLNQAIRNAVREVIERAASRRHDMQPLVYFEVDRAPYAAGPSSFIGELLALLGARNIVSADLGPFPRLNPEYVVRHNPDVIFTSSAEAGHLAERPGWDQVRAVREGRLCYFTPAIRDTIVRPGPRIAEGMRAIADCLARVAPAARVAP
jgi:iron complex transport system substrate-binding protein